MGLLFPVSPSIVGLTKKAAAVKAIPCMGHMTRSWYTVLLDASALPQCCLLGNASHLLYSAVSRCGHPEKALHGDQGTYYCVALCFEAIFNVYVNGKSVTYSMRRLS